MIFTIAASVCFILMIFIVFVVNSFMYIPSITTLITSSYPWDPETPLLRRNSMGENLVRVNDFIDI